MSISKSFYKKTKNTFDICFVAYKYMEKGLDKGYDIFIQVCKNIAALSAPKTVKYLLVLTYCERRLFIRVKRA